jgi:hypothetical protein
MGALYGALLTALRGPLTFWGAFAVVVVVAALVGLLAGLWLRRRARE